MRWASHVAVRAIDDQVILLDLRHDRYSCLRNPANAALHIADSVGIAIGVSAAALVQLQARGLIVDEEPPRKMVRGISCMPVAGPMQVLVAGVWASRALRRLENAVAILRLTKDRQTQTAHADAVALTVFEKWRPLIPRPYVCLFDSLALMHFLLARGVRAEFTIGARTRPFAAHAWVSIEGLPVNDRLGQAGSFHSLLRV